MVHTCKVGLDIGILWTTHIEEPLQGAQGGGAGFAGGGWAEGLGHEIATQRGAKEKLIFGELIWAHPIVPRTRSVHPGPRRHQDRHGQARRR